MSETPTVTAHQGDPRVSENIWTMIEAPDENGCWRWSGRLTYKGYATKSMQGKNLVVHRLVYVLLGGVIPEGLVIDHLCRVRNCVNPAHMEPVTAAENTRRGIAGHNLRTAQQKKTHCPAGHAYSGDNVYLDTRGRRNCRACIRTSHKRRHDAAAPTREATKVVVEIARRFCADGMTDPTDLLRAVNDLNVLLDSA